MVRLGRLDDQNSKLPRHKVSRVMQQLISINGSMKQGARLGLRVKVLQNQHPQACSYQVGTLVILGSCKSRIQGKGNGAT